MWRLGVEDEDRLSTVAPLDPLAEPRHQPWILHLLDVNTMNFCSFAFSPASPCSGPVPTEALVAVPNTLASEAVSVLSPRIFHQLVFTRFIDDVLFNV